MNVARLTDRLKADEGFRSKPYQDTETVWTIGYGRNLDDVGISEGEAAMLLKHDMQTAIDEVSVAVTNWPDLNDMRQEVLANMMFNLGRPRFLAFKKTLAAVEAGDYETAAAEMLDSRWARQVKGRARRLARQMRTGEV